MPEPLELLGLDAELNAKCEIRGERRGKNQENRNLESLENPLSSTSKVAMGKSQNENINEM